MTKLASLLVVAGLGGVAHANAFLLNEFDAKAVGRANASTATDVDPSSIYYNVGGLAASEGTNASVGGALISPKASFNDDLSGSKTDSNTSPQAVPGIFVTSRIHPMVSLGIGFYTPFGLAISWPNTSPQADVVRQATLHTFFITPAVGVNLSSFVPGLTAGAGLDIVPATVELKQDIFFGQDTGSAHLGGQAIGVGGRIGVMYRPDWEPRLSLGAMWRSQVKEDFTGTGDFDAAPQYRPALPPDGDIKTSVTLPQSVVVGAAFRPIEGLEVEANVVWTNWSQFKTLDITVPSAMGTGTMVISTPENYSNTTSFRIGAEYALPGGAAVRAGYYRDPSPIPSTNLTAQLPDIDRNDVAVGGSIALGRYQIHGGLLWVLPGSRTTSSVQDMPQHKGTFDVSAFVAAVTLQARLD